MSSLTVALEFLFGTICFVISTIMETIEDVYLFIESHYDRQRDFEKLDNFTDVGYRHASTEGFSS